LNEKDLAKCTDKEKEKQGEKGYTRIGCNRTRRTQTSKHGNANSIMKLYQRVPPAPNIPQNNLFSDIVLHGKASACINIKQPIHVQNGLRSAHHKNAHSINFIPSNKEHVNGANGGNPGNAGNGNEQNQNEYWDERMMKISAAINSSHAFNNQVIIPFSIQKSKSYQKFVHHKQNPIQNLNQKQKQLIQIPQPRYQIKNFNNKLALPSKMSVNVQTDTDAF
jgi:hypothetical protein